MAGVASGGASLDGGGASLFARAALGGGGAALGGGGAALGGGGGATLRGGGASLFGAGAGSASASSSARKAFGSSATMVLSLPPSSFITSASKALSAKASISSSTFSSSSIGSSSSTSSIGISIASSERSSGSAAATDSASSGTSSPTRARSASTSIGLRTYSSARVRSLRCCSKISSVASLERITTGMLCVAGFFLSFLQTRKPFICGNSMVSRIRSGAEDVAWANPTLPSSTISTLAPRASSAPRTAAAKSGSLSKKRMLAAIDAPRVKREDTWPPLAASTPF